MERRRRRPKTDEIPPEILATWTDEDKRAYRQKKLLKTPLAAAGLSARVVNALEKRNFLLMEDLLKLSREDIMEIQNFGERTFREILKAARTLGVDVPKHWRATRKKPIKRAARREPSASWRGTLPC